MLDRRGVGGKGAQVTSTQLQGMDDIALCEYAKLTSWPLSGPPNLLVLELVRRFEPHAQAPDHQDYPFIANEENLK